MISPPALHLFGGDRLPKKPWCTNDLDRGVVIRARNQAVNFSYIQPNPPNIRFRLVFDIDTDDLFAPLRWEEIGCAANWTASRRQFPPRPHTAYELDIPVLLADADHSRQARFCAAVESALRAKLGADPSYNGTLCKNPLSENWCTVWWSPIPYTLSELSDYLPLERHVPKPGWKPELAHGCGRNVTLFGWLGPEGRYCYREVRRHWGQDGYDGFLEAVRRRAFELNGEFQEPLGLREVNGIVRSIARWTWRRFTPERFSEWQRRRGQAGMAAQLELRGSEEFILLQTARGRRSGRVRRDLAAAQRSQAHQWASAGVSVAEIAERLGRDRTTIWRWRRDVA